MSSQLHQAVELAQAGRRDEARQLLRQYLQTQPHSEVAWLWLASVAADQPEYEQALNEVVRINPANQRAQQLLAEFRQQYRAPFQPPASSASFVPPSAAQPSPSTPMPGYAAPSQPVQPSATPPYTPIQPPATPYFSTPPASRPALENYVSPVSGGRSEDYGERAEDYGARKAKPAEVRVVHERRRGCLGCSFPGCFGCLGCGGCGQSCLILLVVLLIVPLVACGALSFLPISLGPLDLVAVYLPGDMGRKEIGFETGTYDVKLTTPRSWYLAATNNDMWRVGRDVLDASIPFEDAAQTWAEYQDQVGQTYTIVGLDPYMLGEGGAVTTLTVNFDQVQSGDTTCATLQNNPPSGGQIVTYPDGLCGTRSSSSAPGPTTAVLKGIDPPAQVRTITFVTPIDSQTSVAWTLSIPEDIYDHFKDDIDTLIASVRIKRL